MRQERIMELLTEAACQDCSNVRAFQIGKELLAASRIAPTTSTLATKAFEAERLVLISEIFSQTLTSPQRDTLPNLFPFFATACGDLEDGETTAKIDWSVVEKYKK